MAYVSKNGSETLNWLPINDAINQYVLSKTLKFLNDMCVRFTSLIIPLETGQDAGCQL